jgi:hypothetical protein
MKCKYLFLVLIVSSCSESINVQYEVNDNVSSEQIIINCGYTKKGDDGWKKTFCDNEPEGENRWVARAKVFDNSTNIIEQKIIEPPWSIKECTSDETRSKRYKCPIGISPAQISSPYWDGDIYVEGGNVIKQDVSWVYDILRRTCIVNECTYKYGKKTEIKNQIAEVEKKFNIKLYPPAYNSGGIVIGSADDIYDFYVSEYSKHSKPQAEKKLCGYSNGRIASNISISGRVLPELTSVEIDFVDSGKSKYCDNWDPYLNIEPIFLNPSDGMSLSEMADGKEIKVIIDINPQNHSLDDLAKEVLKKSPGYCVYKQSGKNKFHIVNNDNISKCATTCTEHVYDYRGTSILDTIPAKFQYSVSHYEINRGEYDKDDLPEDESGVRFFGGMWVSSFSCPR